MKPALFISAITFALSMGCAHAADAQETAVGHHATAAAGDASPRCQPAQLEQHFFYGTHGVKTRVIDRHRCGVVELRVVDSFDVGSESHTREIFHDRDHDGLFELSHQRVRPLGGSLADLAYGRAVPDLGGRTVLKLKHVSAPAT